MGEVDAVAEPDARRHAREQLRQAAEALFASDPDIYSVGLGSARSGYEFVALRRRRNGVNLARALAPFNMIRSAGRRAEAADVPIRTVQTRSMPSSLAAVGPGTTPKQPEQALQRPLVCGLRIHNVDDDLRTGVLAQGLRTIGTLGCFVHLPDGRLALLSNNHVIAAENQGLRGGDRILQPASRVPDAALHVATLTDFVALNFASNSDTFATAALNTVDAAVAALEPGQLFQQTFLPSRALAAPQGVAEARNHDRVFMVGSQSGYRSGVVTQETAITTIDYGPRLCWFEQSIVIEREDGTPFAQHGDSGAIVVREADHAVIGLLYAANETQAWACPMGLALGAFNSRLA